MRESELFARLREHLGDDYAPAWAAQVGLAELNSRTVQEAVADGVDCKTIWRAAWQQLELPAKYR
mgnify:FL=1